MLAAAASVAGLLAGGCSVETRDTDIKLISVGEVKALWDRQNSGKPDQILLIDPRPTKHYQAGHIPGAKNILLPQVDPKGDREPYIAGNDLIVVYGNDPASAAARGMTKRLMAVGYKGVRFFAGGMKEWRERGYPVKSDPAAEPPNAPEAPAPPDPSAPS